MEFAIKSVPLGLMRTLDNVKTVTHLVMIAINQDLVLLAMGANFWTLVNVLMTVMLENM